MGPELTFDQHCLISANRGTECEAIFSRGGLAPIQVILSLIVALGLTLILFLIARMNREKTKR